MYPELNEEVEKLQGQESNDKRVNKSIDGDTMEKANLNGDRWNIALLLVLYTLQGMPANIAHALPIVLQNRGVSYNDQALFSFVGFPFVLKLFWAPIVDCLYSSKFGRRKSWLVPTQYLLGLLLLYIALNIDDWLGNEANRHPPNVPMLTIMFFLCHLLSATQDVAVDGWSLTMLQKRNVGHSGTCNSVGYALATFFGYILFIVLDSKDFCNRWLRSTPQEVGIMSFSRYMLFWSVSFFITTTFVLFFKKDNSLTIVEDEKEIAMGMKESYTLFWKILNIKSVQRLSWAILTVRIGFGAIYSVTPLKLMDAGLPRDNFALLLLPLIPLQIILPFVISNFLVGPKSLSSLLTIILSRIVFAVMLTILVYLIPLFKVNDGFVTWYYILLAIVYGLEHMANFIISLVFQAFFAKVSDPRFGGTYLTLLNTLQNFGSKWPGSLALYLVNVVTWEKCDTTCTSSKKESCCTTIVDGFYSEMVFSSLATILWLVWARRKVLKLENLDASCWLIERKPKIVKMKNGML